MPATKNPETAYRRVQSAAEKILSADPATIEVVSPGDVVRQGDLYLVRLSRPIHGRPFGSRQLAPGTTQGSRHIVVGDCEIHTVDQEIATAELNQLVPATKGQQQLIGPVVLASGPVTIEHPEHGHRTLPPGTYLVTYQRTWANEIRRVAD